MTSQTRRIFKSIFISAVVVLAIAVLGAAAGWSNVNLVRLTGRGFVELVLVWGALSFWLLHTDAVL